MINSTDSKQDINDVDEITIDDFVKYYNQNIPESFPHATRKSLNEFQSQYPSLFKKDGMWIINKHRKKYMDWLISHRD